VPNSTDLDPHILPQFQVVAEWERRFELAGQAGVARLLGFAMRANMGEYAQATALAQETGEPADIAAVRSFHTKFGAALGLQQQLAPDLGLFARMSFDQGQYEAVDFTDINQSVTLGFSASGERWKRPDDHVGAALLFNRISSDAQAFFNAGGLGILIGDGQLPRPSSERLLETYYSFSVSRGVRVSFDYQYIVNPAYNRDRGPVSVFGFRFHAQI
jgi:high affinity Mn2+ porin